MNAFQKFARMSENERALSAMDMLVDTNTSAEDLRIAWEWTYQHRSEVIITIIKHQIHESLVERVVLKWLQRAAFDICIDGETAVLYRGEACRTEYSPYGLSWTKDRDVAAFFAARSGDAGDPRVYKAEIPTSKILWQSDERLENEVIFDLNWFRKNGTVEMIGSKNELEAWCEAYRQRTSDPMNISSD